MTAYLIAAFTFGVLVGMALAYWLISRVLGVWR